MIPSKVKAAVIKSDLRFFYETLSVYPNLQYLEYNHNDSRNMKGTLARAILLDFYNT